MTQIEHAGAPENRLGTDFFGLPSLLAFKGGCALPLRQPKAARAAAAVPRWPHPPAPGQAQAELTPWSHQRLVRDLADQLRTVLAA